MDPHYKEYKTESMSSKVADLYPAHLVPLILNLSLPLVPSLCPHPSSWQVERVLSAGSGAGQVAGSASGHRHPFAQGHRGRPEPSSAPACRTATACRHEGQKAV